MLYNLIFNFKCKELVLHLNKSIFFCITKQEQVRNVLWLRSNRQTDRQRSKISFHCVCKRKIKIAY